MDVPIKHSYESKRRTPTRLVLIDGFSCSDSSPLFFRRMYKSYVWYAYTSWMYIYIYIVCIYYVLYPVYYCTHHNACTQLTGRSSQNSGVQLGLFRLLCAVLQVSDLSVAFFCWLPGTARERDEIFGVIFRKEQLPRLVPGQPQGASRVCMSPTMGHIPGTRRLKGDACFSYSHHKKQATSLRTGGIILEILGGGCSFLQGGKVRLGEICLTSRPD